MYQFSLLSLRIPIRSFCHATKSRMSTQTSSLAQLRKNTGYPVSKCKKAVELHGSDLNVAEQWLHAEAQKGGWSKISNLESRCSAQGLIGIFARSSVAAMLEVNCETDFVARNSEFKILLSEALSACVQHAIKLDCQEDFVKLHLNSEELCNLKYKSTNLADFVATASGKFGEKTLLRRAVCIKAKENIFLNNSVHPAFNFPDFSGISIGKFGSLLLSKKKDIHQLLDEVNVLEFGVQLCQHIIGMNPNSVGEFTEADMKPLEKQHLNDFVNDQKKENVIEDMTNKSVANEENDTESSVEKEFMTDEEINKQKKVDTNEKRLLHQSFMLDPSFLVGEKLHSLSVEVLHFERFECGETISDMF